MFHTSTAVVIKDVCVLAKSKRAKKSGIKEQTKILIRRRRDLDCFESLTALNLVSVSNKQEELKTIAKALTDSKRIDGLRLPYLSEKQKIIFVFSNSIDMQNCENFNLQILTTLFSPHTQRAKRQAHKSFQEIDATLNQSAKNYRFARASISEVRNASKRLNWTISLVPKSFGVSVTTDNKLGFTKRNESETLAFTLPQRPFAIHTNALVNCLRNSKANVKVFLSFTPVHLSEKEIRFLHDSKNAFNKNKAKISSYPFEFDKTQREEYNSDVILNAINLWLEEPCGYRLTCDITADKPLPASLIEIIGREVFHGGSFEIKDEYSLDQDEFLFLHDCINRDSFDFMLPETQSLLDAGVNRFFDCPHLVFSPDGLLLGHIHRNNDKQEVKFNHADRACHSYVVGATGSGKSTLLYNMIFQDIQNGEGVALIDPHGDLYQSVLASIPEHRYEDVVLFDCCDFEHVVGLNFLECNGIHKQQRMNFITNELIKIFDRLYDLEKTGGPVFEYYMRNALLLVMSNDKRQSTLTDIPLIFEDASFRHTLINDCSNSFVADFWCKQAERASGEMSLNNIAPYITSKLNQFTNNSLLRPMIGQEHSTIDFREIIDDKKILLVNLAKGMLGELDTQLLGMLLIGKLFCTALERADVSPYARTPFYVYIDEVQHFTTNTISSLLSESRKYGLHLTLANQNIAQLSTPNSKTKTLEAILGNCGSLFMFRQGVLDAQYLQAYTTPYLTAQDLQELPSHYAATRILNNMKPSLPFVFQTLPPIKTENPLSLARLIDNSRRCYTKPVNEIENIIQQRRHKTEV